MENVDDILSLNNRRLLYSHIKKYPGIHISAIIKDLNMPEGTVRYHLKFLCKRNIIKIEKIDGYVRCYSKDDFGLKETKVFNILRRKTPRRIMLLLFIYLVSSRKQLSIEINKNPSTIKYYLKKLEKLELIKKIDLQKNIAKTNYKKESYVMINRSGRETFYILKDPYLFYDMLVVNKNNLFDDEIIKSLLYLYNHFKDSLTIWNVNKENKYLFDVNIFIDKVEEAYLDLFPAPFMA